MGVDQDVVLPVAAAGILRGIPGPEDAILAHSGFNSDIAPCPVFAGMVIFLVAKGIFQFLNDFVRKAAAHVQQIQAQAGVVTAPLRIILQSVLDIRPGIGMEHGDELVQFLLDFFLFLLGGDQAHFHKCPDHFIGEALPVCFVEGVGESSLSGDKQLHSMLPAGDFLAAVEIEGDRFGEGQFIFARPPVTAYGTGILIRKCFVGRPDRLILLP